MSFFGNLMNNYMYGKAGQKDYTVSDMPANRFELFGAVLKVRWGSMVGLNLLYMVFWIPAIVWSFIGLLPLFSVEDAFQVNTPQSYLTMYLLGLIPCILITGPFHAGVTYVLRNWARDEHSFVWSDFWEAVRNNWKQALVVSLISGLFPFLTYIGVMFYGQMMNQSVIWVVPLGLLLMIAFVWNLSEMVIYMMMVTYELNIGNLIRNSILITLGSLPKALGIRLATLVVPALVLALAFIAPSIQMQALMVCALLYVVFIPVLNNLLKTSYANAVCEQHLNARIDGAQTNIGLRPENWDDTQYLPEDDEE
ncbi:MAG: YesL family protein [Clostridia bacterium]|nr:YesL family protein [Clostridia bacterium]